MGCQNKDKAKIYHFDLTLFVVGKITNDKEARYYEEVVRLMNEMLQEIRQVRLELQQNNRTCDELNERVRKITFNTS